MDDPPGRTLAYFRSTSSKVFTGAVPFSDGPGTAAIVRMIQAERPPRPTHPSFTDDLWILMQSCWNHNPKLRPNASEVLKAITLSLCKRFVDRTLPTDDRACLITAVFSKPDQAKMARQVPSEEAQNLIDVIYGVSLDPFSCERWSTSAQTPCLQLGLGYSPPGHPQEVPVLFIQGLWSRRAGPSIDDDTALF